MIKIFSFKKVFIVKLKENIILFELEFRIKVLFIHFSLKVNLLTTIMYLIMSLVNIIFHIFDFYSLSIS